MWMKYKFARSERKVQKARMLFVGGLKSRSVACHGNYKIFIKVTRRQWVAKWKHGLVFG